MSIQEKISTLWVMVMLNMILADVLSAFIAFTDPDVLGMPENIKFFMAVFALVINLPIAMIFLSRKLPREQNRIANLVVGVITIIFIVGGGSMLPHYVVIAAIEIAMIALIMWMAWSWPQEVATQTVRSAARDKSE